MGKAVVFEFPDSEIHRCMLSVVFAGFDRGNAAVGNKGAVPPPVCPQLSLGSGGAGAADDQPQRRPPRGAEDGFGCLGLSAFGIADGRPVFFGDRFDRCPHLRMHGNSDRPARPQAVQRFDQPIGPEPGVGPHRNRAFGSGPPHPADGLGDEIDAAPPRRPSPQATTSPVPARTASSG